MGNIISKKPSPAGAETGGGWERYLTAEEQETVLGEADLIRHGQRPECHWEKEGSATFWAPTSDFSLKCKLAELLVALEGGADPNEREAQPVRQLLCGRPLDLCLNDSRADSRGSLLNNVPVIQMLLDYGADPRLDPIPGWKGHVAVPLEPVAEAKLLAEVAKWGPMKDFYKEAYQVLKLAADRLDRLDRRHGTPGPEEDTGMGGPACREMGLG